MLPLRELPRAFRCSLKLPVAGLPQLVGCTGVPLTTSMPPIPACMEDAVTDLGSEEGDHSGPAPWKKFN